MPRVTEYDNLPLKPKRKQNLPAAEQEDENKENTRRIKKRKKNDTTLNGNTEEVACTTEVVAYSQPVKRIKSTATSTKSLKRKKNHCKKECVICINTKRSSKFTDMSCDHSFHTTCIQTWFKVKESCPICMPANNTTSDRSEFEDLYEFSNTVECVICMDTEEFPDYEFTPCGHSFHAICLQTWFQVKHICPICMPYNSDTVCSNIFEDQEEIDEFAEEVRCLICLDTEETSNFEVISCCHSFHVVCIQSWFAVKQVCPVCMVNNPSIVFEDDAVYEVFDEYFDEVGCNICMDTEVHSDFQHLSCGHDVHAVCVKSWIEKNKSCPACLREISINIASNTLKKEEDEQGDRCAICMDTEESSAFEFLPCCHSFHVECIQNWIKKEKSCPICKTHIPVNERVNVFEAQGANACNNEGNNIDVNDRINIFEAQAGNAYNNDNDNIDVNNRIDIFAAQGVFEAQAGNAYNNDNDNIDVNNRIDIFAAQGVFEAQAGNAYNNDNDNIDVNNRIDIFAAQGVFEAQGANAYNNESDNINVNDRVDADAMNIPHNQPQPDGIFLLYSFPDGLSITHL